MAQAMVYGKAQHSLSAHFFLMILLCVFDIRRIAMLRVFSPILVHSHRRVLLHQCSDSRAVCVWNAFPILKHSSLCKFAVKNKPKPSPNRCCCSQISPFPLDQLTQNLSQRRKNALPMIKAKQHEENNIGADVRDGIYLILHVLHILT